MAVALGVLVAVGVSVGPGVGVDVAVPAGVGVGVTASTIEWRVLLPPLAYPLPPAAEMLIVDSSVSAIVYGLLTQTDVKLTSVRVMGARK